MDSIVKGKYSRAPRIVGLYLINIQTYTQPTFIPFSLERTVFRGPNDAGKSVISKALQLFGGVFDKEDYAILVNYNHDEGYEYLYLDNRTILVAHITVRTEFKGTENEKRVGAVTFYLYNWQMSAVLKQWDKYDMEIAEYLGWVTIQEDNFCVNFMDGKRNILINTNPVFNTRLTESVCRNYDIERRIEHIEGAIKKVRQTKTQVQQELDKLQDKLTHFELPVKDLVECKDALNNTLFSMNINCYVEDSLFALVNMGLLSELRASYLSMMAIIDMRIFVQSLSEINNKEKEHQMTKELLANVYGQFVTANLKRLIEQQRAHAELVASRSRYSAIMTEASVLFGIMEGIEVHVERANVLADGASLSERLKATKELERLELGRVTSEGILKEATNLITGMGVRAVLLKDRGQAINKVASHLIKECITGVAEKSADTVTSYRSTAVMGITDILILLFEAHKLTEMRKDVQKQKEAIPICPYCNQIIPKTDEHSECLHA